MMSSHKIIQLAGIVLGLACSGITPCQAEKVVLSDHFAGKTTTMPDGSEKLYPDQNIWAFTFWPGTVWPTSYGNGTNWLEGNSECQTYVTPFLSTVKGQAVPVELRYDPFEIKSDGLHIKASLLSRPQQSIYKIGAYRRFGSGMLLSRQSFLYGKMHMVAKLPAVPGSWPAFWLLPTAHKWPPEIDVFEGMVWAKHSQQIHSGYLIPKPDGRGLSQWFDLGFDPSQGFHDYELDWTEDNITAKVDGKTLWEKPTPESMHQEMYILANLAVGGKWVYNELDVDPIDDRSMERLMRGSDLIQDKYPAEMVIRSITVTQE